MEHLSKETISAIKEFLKSGETFAEIARRTGVSEDAVTALWRRLKKVSAVSDVNLIKTISDLERKQADIPDFLRDRKNSFVRFKADLLVMLNLSAHQIQVHTGYSHSHIKSIRKKLREQEYLKLFDKAKQKIAISSLQYHLIESLFLAFYFRAVVVENKHEINLSALVLAFSELEQTLYLPEFQCLLVKKSRLMLKDFLQSLYEIRENIKLVNVCSSCDCIYAVQPSSKQSVNSDCPFCLFRKKYKKESNLKIRKKRRTAFRSSTINPPHRSTEENLRDKAADAADVPDLSMNSYLLKDAIDD